MVGTFAQGLPWAVSRRFLAGLSLTALVAVAGSTVMPDCAAGQIKAEAPPRPDPDGDARRAMPPLLAFGTSAWFGLGLLETAATAAFVSQIGAARSPTMSR